MENVIEDNDFVQLMQNHIQEIVAHFFTKEQNFGILCKIDKVSFEPELPQEISKEFHSMTLFYLAGYTFETAHIQDDFLIFEAGFGADNFGCLVSVPLLSIMQIIVDETPLFINLASYKENEQVTKEADDSGIKNSMASFLSNPENSKFIK